MGLRERIFSNLKHLMIQQKIELLDPTQDSLGQLRSLESKRETSSGNLEICTPHGTSTDGHLPWP